jgi:TIR domain/Sel1 repeat
MSGIFLSYSRTDLTLAERIVRRLRGLGVEVWWDQDMPGVDWQDELQQRAGELTGVLVVWTPNSFASRHVKDEARLARESDKLINVVVDLPQPPFPFDAVNALPLDGWTGREPHGGWSRTVKTIETLLVAAGAAAPGALSGALTKHEAEISRRRRVAAEARSKLQEAQTGEADAVDAAARATAGFVRAETEVRSVVSQGLGLRVVDAARQELDAAEQAKSEAEQALQSAKARLSAAARTLGKASADLEAEIDEPETDTDAPPREALGIESHQPINGSPERQDAPAKSRADTLPVEMARTVALSTEGQAREAATDRAIAGADEEAAASPISFASTDSEPPRPKTRLLSAPPDARLPVWRRRWIWVGAPIAALAAGMWLVLPGLCERFGDQAYDAHHYSAAFPLYTIGTYAWDSEKRAGAEDGLSTLYAIGEGAKQDFAQSLYWQQKAAKDGCMICMQSLGETYDTGNHVPRDETLARYWYEMALTHGSVVAAAWLAKHPP